MSKKDLQDVLPPTVDSDEETVSDVDSDAEPEDERMIVAAVEEEVLGVSDKDNKMTDLEERTKAILERASQSKNPKVNAMYARWQKKWFDFVKKNKVDDIFNDLNMVAFFDELLNYQPSTLWVAYSCINSWYKLNHNLNLNTWGRLREYLKNRTKDCIANKAATFSNEEIDKAVLMYFSSGDERDLLKSVTILLAYYGLLRMADLMKIKAKDVMYNKKERCYQVVFNYKRKRRNTGLTYLIPACYNVIMERYISQLRETKCKGKNVRFLRNYNIKAHARLQNAGKTNMGKFAKETAKDLNLEEAKYSNHSWHRSGATNLADSGCSRTNLKRHGQWQSDAVAEGYIANSRPLRLEKMNMLKPDRLKKEDKEKERKLEAENLLNALGVARKPSTQVMEIFMEKPEKVELLPDKILSQLEVDSSDEEPKKKKAKVGVAKEDVADLHAKAGGPIYSNCHVTINYVGQK